jgi:hypothetical protein
MFEKEAEEYAKQNNPAEYGVRATHFTVLNSFKDGAEFGFNKANEWQFVSEKGLPKESGRYLVYVGGGENGVYPLDFDTEANDFGYWCLDVGDNLGVRDTIFETITERNEDKVIAWKEIVLPELKESE